MPTCEVCHNEYDKAFTVTLAGSEHIFDSFECAIHALAPACPHCHCRVIGHGVEQNGQIFRNVILCKPIHLGSKVG
jgi:hypothetical protein